MNFWRPCLADGTLELDSPFAIFTGYADGYTRAQVMAVGSNRRDIQGIASDVCG